MALRTFEVGKPYIEGRKWKDDSSEYNYFKNGHELRIFLKNVTQNDLDLFAGNLNIGFFVKDSVIFLVWEFQKGNQRFSDINTFSIHLIPKDVFQEPEIP